jgi:hypothetical protein
MLFKKLRPAIVAFIIATPSYGQGVPTGGGSIYTIAELQALVADLCKTDPSICSAVKSEATDE